MSVGIKIIMTVCLLVSAGLLMQMAEEFFGKKKPWQIFVLFVTSAIFVSGILYANQSTGQYQALVMVWILLGVRSYLKNEDWKFVTFFALAILFDYFAIFLFIPLLLLQKQGIWKRAGKCIAGLFPVALVCIIIAVGSAGERWTPEWFVPLKAMQNLSEYAWFEDRLPLFWFVYFILLLYCAVRNRSKKEWSVMQERQLVIYIGMAVWLVLLLLSPYPPGTAMYLVPFLILQVSFSGRRYSINMLLFLVLDAGMTMMAYQWYPDNYGIGTVLADFYNKLATFDLPIVITSLCTLAGIDLLWENWPGRADIAFAADKVLFGIKIVLSVIVVCFPVIW